MRNLLIVLTLFLPACGGVVLDVAEPLEDAADGDSGDSCVLDLERNRCLDTLDTGLDTGRVSNLIDTAGGEDGADSGIDSGHDSGAPDTYDAGHDTAPAPDTAKPDTHCPNPDDWTNCGMCCYPAICVGGAGGTCG